MGSVGIKALRDRLPEEFLDMLHEIYSGSEIDSILKSYVYGRKSSLRINESKARKREIFSCLRSMSVKFNELYGLNDCIIFDKRYEKIIRNSKLYDEGKIYFQNPSSIIPPSFLEINEGDNILDMCAAPGGKTLKIFNIAKDKAKIFANEPNKVRRDRLCYNLEKQGVSSVEVMDMDGRFIGNKYEDYFDRIMLDAPCSGEGTFNIRDYNKIKKLRLEESKNIEFARKQRKLLESAYKALKVGGVIVYSTCTISPIENEGVIDTFISKHNDIKIENIKLEGVKFRKGIIEYKGQKFDGDLSKSIRIISNDIMEGFYICKMRKN